MNLDTLWTSRSCAIYFTVAITVLVVYLQSTKVGYNSWSQLNDLVHSQASFTDKIYQYFYLNSLNTLDFVTTSYQMPSPHFYTFFLIEIKWALLTTHKIKIIVWTVLAFRKLNNLEWMRKFSLRAVLSIEKYCLATLMSFHGANSYQLVIHKKPLLISFYLISAKSSCLYLN